MRMFFTLLAFVCIQSINAQSDQDLDSYFSNEGFVHAKVNNDEAFKFFSTYYCYLTSSNDGNVLVSFIVKKDGQLDSIQVLNNPGTLYKSTVLDALNQSSGHWNPCRFEDKLFDKKYFAAFNFTNRDIFLYKKNKAARFIKAGETTRPLRIITEALKICPFDIDLLLWRARIYRKQNKHYLEAIDLLMAEKLKTDLIFNIWF